MKTLIFGILAVIGTWCIYSIVKYQVSRKRKAGKSSLMLARDKFEKARDAYREILVIAIKKSLTALGVTKEYRMVDLSDLFEKNWDGIGKYGWTGKGDPGFYRLIRFGCNKVGELDMIGCETTGYDVWDRFNEIDFSCDELDEIKDLLECVLEEVGKGNIILEKNEKGKTIDAKIIDA